MNKKEKIVLAKKLADWLGKENISYFKHLYGLTGSVTPVLRLNMGRKGIPTHPIHWREGMAIRNYLRTLEECRSWNDHDFDNNYVKILEYVIKK